MRSVVGVERKTHGVRRDVEPPRELFTQRGAHAGEAQRVFMAAKVAGSRAFVVAEGCEGGRVERRSEVDVNPPQRNVGRAVVGQRNRVDGIHSSDVMGAIADA